MCSSHNGEPRHIAAVQSVLAKIGLDESALGCGIHPPLSVEAAADRWRKELEPTPACNNCSGVHAGMLVACRAEGWPMSEYGNPSHPLQRRIREVVAEFAGVPAADIQEAVDTCAVPTFRLPLFRAALMFARLASGRGVSDALAGAASSVRTAMTAYPEMVGGEHRLDSDLMRATAGSLVAKGGAEGFQGIGATQSGAGLALKVSDGGAGAAMAATIRALEEAELLPPEALSALDAYRAPSVKTLRGQIAGQVVPTFKLRALR
jgi:L-asparaginase II